MPAIERSETASRRSIPSDGALALTALQRERRARIVRAALALASGGYDAVRIRTVATQSNVARATVYYYFASKDHLLVACLHQWLMDFAADATAGLNDIVDPYDRLLNLLDRLNATLCATPHFADAVARAYRFANAEAGPVVEDTRAQLGEMFAAAMGGGEVIDHYRDVGQLVTDVWAANVLAVVHQRATADQLRHRVHLAVDVIRRRRVCTVRQS